MTKEQINRKIALQQGWSMVEGGWWRYDGSYEPVEPNYCNDLNAMHRAWQTLTLAQKRKFETELYKVIIGDGDYNRNDDAMNITNATSRQRAEAFVRTLGLLED